MPNIEYFATWVASWLEPLSKTGLGFTAWEAQSRSTGAYISILLVLVLLVGRALLARRRKVAVFFIASILMFVLLGANVVLAMVTKGLTEQQQILFWRNDVWKWAYCLFCASIPCFVVTTTYLVRLPGHTDPPTGGTPPP